MTLSIRLALSVFAVLATALACAAETAPAGPLTGVVTDGVSGLPVAGASVRWSGEGGPVVTDAQGRFAVPARAGALVVRCPGYEAAQVDVALPPAGLPGPLAVGLMPEPVRLADLIVTPSRYGVGTARPLAPVLLTGEDLETRPQIGEDLYRSLARLPGVAADDFTAKFWVRGAPNDQVLARLDGVELLEPFHLKDVDGALSIVDLQTIGRLELVSGGFSTEYGDRLAGVLAMETESGDAIRPRTSLGLSLTSLRAGSRGQWGEGRGRWLATIRRGYPDVALKVRGREHDLTPRYYDAQAKLEYQLTPEQTVSLHFLHADDTLRVRTAGDPPLNSSYGSDYVWARWRGTLRNGLEGETVLSATRLNWQRAADGLFDNRYRLHLHDVRRLDRIALRQEWTYSAGEVAVLRGGFDARADWARYDYDTWRERSVVKGDTVVVERSGAQAAVTPAADAAGGFLATRFRLARALTLEPGVRFDWQGHTDEAQWSPRLNGALALDRATIVRAAWGCIDRRRGCTSCLCTTGSPSLQRQMGGGLSLRIEGYERRTAHLRAHWENLLFPYDIFPETLTDRVRFDPSRGRARGVEVLVQRRGPRWEWGASYALARAEERIGQRWVPRVRDQRHSLQADVGYRPNPRWHFSAAWQFHTGWPVTDTSFSIVTLANGKRTIVRTLGPAYAGRLPEYHRLDFRMTRRFALKQGEMRVFLDIFNVYDRTNVLGYQRNASISGSQVVVKTEGKDLLPIMPSCGVSWEF